jgi:hypothetical protein
VELVCKQLRNEIVKKICAHFCLCAMHRTGSVGTRGFLSNFILIKLLDVFISIPVLAVNK